MVYSVSSSLLLFPAASFRSIADVFRVILAAYKYSHSDFKEDIFSHLYHLLRRSAPPSKDQKLPRLSFS